LRYLRSSEAGDAATTDPDLLTGLFRRLLDTQLEDQLLAEAPTETETQGVVAQITETQDAPTR